jgi:hypothetical protein
MIESIRSSTSPSILWFLRFHGEFQKYRCSLKD